MARGDAVSAFGDAIANGSSMTYQPAAGVEVMVVSNFVATDGGGIYTQAIGDFYIGLTNGTIKTFLQNRPPSTTIPGHIGPLDFELLLNNTRYLEIKNSSGAAKDLAFTGVQMK